MNTNDKQESPTQQRLLHLYERVEAALERWEVKAILREYEAIRNKE